MCGGVVNSPRIRCAISWLIAATILGGGVGVVLPHRAHAQSFLYHPMAAGETVNIPIDWRDEDEWFGDPYPNFAPIGTVPRTNRYAANQNHRIRIIGNPNVRRPRVHFWTLRMNSVAVGGLADSFRVQWGGTNYGESWAWGDYGSNPSGPDVNTLGLLIDSATANYSLMHPGAYLNFRSGPAWSGSGAYFESEDQGFRIASMDFIGTGSQGTWIVPTLNAHERVLGVLLGGGSTNGDTVDFRLPAHATGRYTVQLWLDNPNSGDVLLWANCG